MNILQRYYITCFMLISTNFQVFEQDMGIFHKKDTNNLNASIFFYKLGLCHIYDITLSIYISSLSFISIFSKTLFLLIQL